RDNVNITRFADPGRYGSPVSASGYSPLSNEIVRDRPANPDAGDTEYTYGINFLRASERRVLDSFAGSYNITTSGSLSNELGNGFYRKTISCSNYEKNVLNAWAMTTASVNFNKSSEEAGEGSLSLSASTDAMLIQYTSSVMSIT